MTKAAWVEKRLAKWRQMRQISKLSRNYTEDKSSQPITHPAQEKSCTLSASPIALYPANFVGKVYGGLIVISYHGRVNAKHLLWSVRCRCGKTYIKEAYEIKTNQYGCRACACKRKREVEDIDLVGRIYGGYTVIAPRGVSWSVRCMCGEMRIVCLASLQRNRYGCRKCADKIRTKNNVKHGMSDTRVYSIWQGMKRRCNNPKDLNYGGRGITYDPRWKEFVNFFADMGEPPSPKHSIHRIDPNGNYCKDNCIWATIEVQNNNTRRNVYVNLCGITKTKTQWARYLSLHPEAFSRWNKKDMERLLYPKEELAYDKNRKNNHNSVKLLAANS